MRLRRSLSSRSADTARNISPSACPFTANKLAYAYTYCHSPFTAVAPRLHPASSMSRPAAESGHAPCRLSLSLRIPLSHACCPTGARRRLAWTACLDPSGKRPGLCSRGGDSGRPWYGVSRGGPGACRTGSRSTLVSLRSGSSETPYMLPVCRASALSRLKPRHSRMVCGGSPHGGLEDSMVQPVVVEGGGCFRHASGNCASYPCRPGRT